MARILVVEDDPWSQRIVVELLEMRGHDVVAASDLATARAELAKKPQVVLLDIHVPGGGGERLLREIRSSAEHASLPVIALTASAMSGDKEKFLRLGFTAYLSKPIDVKSFGPTIESYVRDTEAP
jgi:CheY-like chemotaxis protein